MCIILGVNVLSWNSLPHDWRSLSGSLAEGVRVWLDTGHEA